MFTPPPSPGLVPEHLKDGILVPAVTPPTSPNSLKRRIGRRTKWTVVLVPMALILITVSTRYLTHPAAFDMFSEPPSLNWETLSARASEWAPHKRHPLPAPANDAATVLPGQSGSFPSGTSSNSAASTGLPSSDQTVPTVPASPPTLPTPFPQPFDSDLSQNFSSISCFQFFSNMTNTPAFRSCRAFSLLLQSSAAFIEAQNNLDSLNNIVWGTCNTSIEEDQCNANIAWFSSNLATSCAIDLKDGNSMAVNTQLALNAFGLMRSAGCLVDPSTDTYCYLDAVRNSNPSDTYFYSVPLGFTIPNNTIASCSACTKSLMTLYYGALSNSTLSSGLTGLQKSYDSAAKIAVADCGTAYATLTTAGAANTALPLPNSPRMLAATLLSLTFTLVLLSMP
ncbi:hypothetical protein C8R43DRAFT_1003906 [Mycena crocata]|nr:hypothetical protein C8R43DRAFT_1003906 [Mycena crocata]